MEVTDSDEAWAAQLGPALSEQSTAALLGLPVEEIQRAPGLLRVDNRAGQPVYPAVQFDGPRQVPGIAEVVRILSEALLPLTVAAWLTAPNAALEGRPVDRLRDGAVEPVLRLARQLAASARL